MNHKLKTTIFKCLSILPDSLGFYLYHKMQNLSQSDSLEYKIDSTKQSFETILRILTKNNIELENKNISEIGSGWLPILPYFFKFVSKAKKIDTFDINDHYNASEILKLNALFSRTYSIPNNLFKGKFQLPPEIHYFSKTNISDGDLTNTDLIISRFVLEHISPENINEMHQSFVKQLKKGSYILHLISPSDHRAYNDSSISLYDFLKYSQNEWDAIQTTFDYHNRLRLPQYLNLFEKEFEIVFVEFESCKVGSEAYNKFKKLKINEEFINYSDEELTAGSINILLKVN